jgi:TRAP-type mannitol/chloroaromatic compound transport system permease small subunit
MQRWLRLAAGIDRFNARIGRFVYWLTLIMVLVGSFNAVARYLGRYIGVNLSSNAFLEAQLYLFGILFLLGAAYTLLEDGHVRVDVAYSMLSDRGRAWINLLGSVLFLIPFCILMLWVTWSYVVNSWSVWEMSPDPGGLPRYPIKTIIPIAFVLLILQGFSQFIKHLAEVLGLSDASDSHAETSEAV